MNKTANIKIATFLFLSVVLINVFAVIFNNNTLEIVFKPLIMISLGLLYFISVKKIDFWFVSALFFSLLGDIFLLNKQNYFVFGLASFLITHIIYLKISVGFLQKQLTYKIILASVPFIALFIWILYLIFNNLKNLLIPVLSYGIVLVAFGTSALLNYLQKKMPISTNLLLGALLFIASDSLIALNNFYLPKHLFSILLILFYMSSQYFICKAMINKNDILQSNQ